jgi:hypothetical protein
MDSAKHPEFATHYSACSLPMTLGGICFSQHYNAYQQSCLFWCQHVQDTKTSVLYNRLFVTETHMFISMFKEITVKQLVHSF